MIKQHLQKIGMIGLGYIGLPTAATLAAKGYRVLGIDVSKEAVDTINAGKVHIIEPDLDNLVREVVESGRLMAKTTLEPADSCDIYMIAVPTPFLENKKPDLSYVKSAVETLAPALKKGDCIILESTSPVGTTAKIAEWLQALRPDLLIPVESGTETYDITLAYCPERVLPGKVLHEIVHNDRVIGGFTPNCAEKVCEFYKTFVKGDCIKTNARTAAMCKLTENAYRDVNIAFANELSMICEKQGIDVWELRSLANRHPRVDILKPGPGVGGHCIAVDPWFIVDAAPERANLIRTAREVNDFKPDYVINCIVNSIKQEQVHRVVCWGIAFKPDIDDLRESPAIKIVTSLKQLLCDCSISVVEPNVDKIPERYISEEEVSLVGVDAALTETDALHVFLVAHSCFNSADIQRLKHKLDFCGILS